MGDIEATGLIRRSGYTMPMRLVPTRRSGQPDGRFWCVSLQS